MTNSSFNFEKVVFSVNGFVLKNYMYLNFGKFVKRSGFQNIVNELYFCFPF